jgi:hypothetical protein
VSVRNTRAAKAARRTARDTKIAPAAPAQWDGTVSREDIAGVVREIVTANARELFGLVPEQLCLSYGITGAMMATLATGRRHALQIGGFGVHDFQGNLAYSYGPGFPARGWVTGGTEYHTWFSQVPDNADPEMLWALPPWGQVCDLTVTYFTSTHSAVAHCGRPALPPWFWDERTEVRDRYGITYKPDHQTTMRILAASFRDGCADQTWHTATSQRAAWYLGLDMGDLVPLAPGSILVGHPPREKAAA